MARPVAVGANSLYGQRSLPQMQARVTRTSASVGSMSRASGTVSIRTSPAPNMMVARMVLQLRCPVGAGAPGMRMNVTSRLASRLVFMIPLP
jgi:hypothetical protein